MKENTVPARRFVSENLTIPLTSKSPRWLLICIQAGIGFLLTTFAMSSESSAFFDKGPDIDVANVISIPSSTPTQRVTAAIGTPNGGLVLGGSDGAKSAFVRLISPEGATVWESELPASAGTFVRTVHNGFSGDYRITGIAKDGPPNSLKPARQYDFVQRVSKHGVASLRIAVTVGEFAQFFKCAVEVTDGYLLAGGNRSSSEAFGLAVPLIVKVDSKGQVTWDHSIQPEQKQVFMEDLSRRNCSGLSVDTNGHILWGLDGNVTPLGNSGKDWANNTFRLGQYANLVIELDASGKELHRKLRRNVRNLFLIPNAGNHIFLFEMLAPFTPKPTTVAESIKMQQTYVAPQLGLQKFELGSDFSDGKTDVLIGDGYQISLITAVHLTSNNGAIVLDYPAVWYVNTAGMISHARQIKGSDIPRGCDVAPFLEDVNAGEARLYCRNDATQDKIITLRYRD